MRYKNVPEGWWFDQGEPSMLGDQWIHDDCPTLQGPGSDEVEGVEEETKQVGDADQHGMGVVTYLLSCKDCGQQVVFDNNEFVGFPEDEVAEAA